MPYDLRAFDPGDVRKGLLGVRQARDDIGFNPHVAVPFGEHDGKIRIQVNADHRLDSSFTKGEVRLMELLHAIAKTKKTARRDF